MPQQTDEVLENDGQGLDEQSHASLLPQSTKSKRCVNASRSQHSQNTNKNAVFKFSKPPDGMNPSYSQKPDGPPLPNKATITEKSVKNDIEEAQPKLGSQLDLSVSVPAAKETNQNANQPENKLPEPESSPPPGTPKKGPSSPKQTDSPDF